MVKEKYLMRKILILLLILLFSVIGCGNDQVKIYEPIVTENKIEFPFKKLNNGKMGVIFRNHHTESINISVILISRDELIDDSQNQDFCNDIKLMRSGIMIEKWVTIQFNFPVISEGAIANQNDNPNLISYNLPKGTYLVMLQDSESCNRDNYITFDIKTNDAFKN